MSLIDLFRIDIGLICSLNAILEFSSEFFTIITSIILIV